MNNYGSFKSSFKIRALLVIIPPTYLLSIRLPTITLFPRVFHHQIMFNRILTGLHSILVYRYSISLYVSMVNIDKQHNEFEYLFIIKLSSRTAFVRQVWVFSRLKKNLRSKTVPSLC